jgi:hypothetical protein
LQSLAVIAFQSRILEGDTTEVMSPRFGYAVMGYSQRRVRCL